MKVLFPKSIVVLSLLSLLSGTAYAQNQYGGALDNHKFLYGIHLGFTDNEFDIYSTNGGLIASQDGTLHTDGSHYNTYGFRLAVIGEAHTDAVYLDGSGDGQDVVMQGKQHEISGFVRFIQPA